MKGNKTKLLRGDGAEPEVFTEVAEILEVGDIKVTRGIFDDTTFDSPDDYEEVSGGLKKFEPVDFKVKYKKDATIATLLRADIDKPNPINYRIEWPDTPATTLNFKALVTSISISTPKTENVTESFTFTPSGKPTWG